jgi:hypothetical protein
VAVATRRVVGNSVAIADIEAVLGAVPPNRVLHEPRERCRKSIVELARIDVVGDVGED